MTAEVVIMNKEAVAVAADSAVTVHKEYQQKSFVSANKLFALSKYHPVCIMVYGSATFMELPWETIVKTYRCALSRGGFKTLGGYADHFLAFLGSDQALFPQDAQLGFFETNVRSWYAVMRKEIDDAAQVLINEKGEIRDEEVANIVRETINKHLKLWQAGGDASGCVEKSPQELEGVYLESITAARKAIFQQLPIDPIDSASLETIALSLFTRFPEAIVKLTSGIVITGFGQEDTFPALRCSIVHGVANNRLRYKEDKEQKIGRKQPRAFIRAFAQSEEVATFMEGVNPNYQRAIEEQFSKMLDEYPGIILDQIENLGEDERSAIKARLAASSNKRLAEYNVALREHRIRTHIQPVIDAVAYLPKDELAAMAESLVRLTSFKRKVTIEPETVAEPIDVAVISKGDGFIWMKRKHYFQPVLNPQFFANYYREDKHEQEKEAVRSANPLD